MSDLRELYQEIILDHNRRPRNFGELGDADHQAVGHNPLCGDRIVVQVRIADGRIEDVKFTGAGCAISKASASLMTDAIKGKTIDEVHQLFGDFHRMVTSELDTMPPVDRLKKLAAFSGVREFPTRVKCASLAWHTLEAALQEDHRLVTTEA